jgi:hypothetical protein
MTDSSSNRDIRPHERPHGRMSKKLAGVLAAGGGLFAIVHFVGGGALVHVVLPILLGAAAWQWAGGIGVGLLVAGGVLYFGVRRWRRRSAHEGKKT